MRKIFGAGVLAIALVGLALADEVKKVDGTVVSGTIVDENEDHVTIRNKLGDVRIARKDVASVSKSAPKGIDADLERLKASTSERLEVIAREAERRGRFDAARSLRVRIDEVKAWKLPIPEGVQRKDALDWLDVAVKFEKIDVDETTTTAQKTAAIELLVKEISDKPTVSKMTIIDVTTDGDHVSVRGSVGNLQPTWYFFGEADKKKLVGMKRDDQIMVEGTIYHEGKLNYQPGIRDARLR